MALKDESLVALRVAHLSMVQGVITRMSGFSASAKTFTITILAGLTAISLQADAAQVGVIAMGTAIILFFIDTYYMILERRFRALYDEIAARNLADAIDMNIVPIVQPGDRIKAIKSKSSLLFYGPLLFACILFIVYGLIYEQKPERLSRSDTPRVEQLAASKPNPAGKPFEPTAQPAAVTKRGFGCLPGQPVGTADVRGAVRSESAPERTGRLVRTKPSDSTTP